jgi:NADH-quinone oxidoreductase subunit A
LDGADAQTLWPLVVYVAAVMLTIGGMVAASFVLGERHRERQTGEPYESGIVPAGPARVRLAADFYLVAMFFVIFDLESVFVFAWAVAVRQVGWAGYAEVLVFIAVLVAALVYLWKTGALDWGTVRHLAGRARRGRAHV